MAGQGAYIFGCEGPALSSREADFFAETDPFGFILFARNVETPDQLRALTDALRDAVGWNAPVLIDQEGGRVQRMTPPHWRQWRPPLDEVTAAGQKAVRVMYLRYRLIAEELRSVGIDVNCAPIADVLTDTTHPVLRNRCYSSDAVEVMEIAGAVAAGLMAGGVLPVVKHIPGHGRATVDSHLEPPRTDVSFDLLTRSDFLAFTPFGNLPMGMSCHVVYDALDPELPGTLSPLVQRYVREKLRFNGLVMTDDISMEALAGSVEERGANALAAGCDIVLHCNGEMAEMHAIAQGCGAMSAAAHDRAERALLARRDPDDVDIKALEAEFAALTGDKTNG